jgi:hypothetical protein
MPRLRIARYHVVQEFNKGVYDYIIATDEGGNKQSDEISCGSSNEDQEEGERCAFCDYSWLASF